MDINLNQNTREALFDYLLRLGDDRLVLGHRLSEWCGHGPILEEDIALTNIALDCIGQAEHFLQLAAEIENEGRDADDLVYLREAVDYKNLMLVEQPNGDFAFTIARQFLFNVFSSNLLEALLISHYQRLADLSAKALKESHYHLRHSREWVLRLGDGTEESHHKIQNAFDDLWGYTGEIFSCNEVDALLIEAEIVPDISVMHADWEEKVARTMNEATLIIPEVKQFSHGSREGQHTEHLGRMLAEMQILHRSYPEVAW